MRQSFTWWSFTLAEEPDDVGAFLEAASDVGFDGVEMLASEHFSAAADAGLSLVTATGHEIEHGFNDPALHAQLHDTVGSMIEEANAAGIANVIVFSGNHIGDDDETAIANCAAGLAPLAEQAERCGITLLLELLNSKVDHPGYQCDRSEWGFEVVRQVDSAGLRVLFDAYHMQLMEGDLLRTIKANLPLIGHFHTAGVPGRRDLDDRQEVHWKALAGLLDHLGYEGWVGHEFMPRGGALEALAHAHTIFDRPQGDI